MANHNATGKKSKKGPELVQRCRGAVLNALDLMESRGKTISELLADEFSKRSNTGVYIVEAVGTGMCKIGYAKNIRNRVDALQTACPYELRVRATINGTRETESAFHRIHARNRVRGEWFNLQNQGFGLQ